VRGKDGVYIGQKPCAACYGTGKNYKAISENLLIDCLENYIRSGYSEEEAWNHCFSYFKLKTIKLLDGKTVELTG
jgi:hypothetical protein